VTASLDSNIENKFGGNADLQKMGWQHVPDFKVDSKPKDHMGPFIMIRKA